MAETFKGYIRRIDFEPKQEFLGVRIYTHVFFVVDPEEQIDAYTDDPRLEAALLAAWDLHPPRQIIEVHYENDGNERRITRVTLDRDFPPRP